MITLWDITQFQSVMIWRIGNESLKPTFLTLCTFQVQTSERQRLLLRLRKNIWLNSPHECNLLHETHTRTHPPQTPLMWRCRAFISKYIERDIYTSWTLRGACSPARLGPARPAGYAPQSFPSTRCRHQRDLETGPNYFSTKGPLQVETQAGQLILAGLIAGESCFQFVWAAVELQPPPAGLGWSSRCVGEGGEGEGEGECAVQHPATRWSSSTETQVLF